MGKITEKYWHLKKCDLFRHLAPEQLKELEPKCRIRRFARNSPVYLPADQADGVLVLVSGRVKICSFTHDGKQGILTFVEPGEMFGELALLEPGEREEYAEAVDSSVIVFIPVDAMELLLRQHADLALGVSRLIGLRRRRIERRLKYLLFHSNRERIIHLVLELSESYGRTTPDGTEIGIRLSHQDLANIIGSTRETVTVTLGQLQAEGLLKVGRRKITVRDIERLANEVSASMPRVRSDPKGPDSPLNRSVAADPELAQRKMKSFAIANIL